MSAPARHGHTAGGRGDLRSRSPTYDSWQSMLSRCNRPGNVAYARYGGAGVKVCARWATFEHFLADMGERPDGKSLERIDNAKGYEPGNCRWATAKEQARNRRSNSRLTHAGKTMTQAEWAAEIGISQDTLSKRISGGWSVERALTATLRPYQRQPK